MTELALKTFVLEGTDRMGRPVQAQRFSCYPVMQGEIVARAIAAVQQDGGNGLVEIAEFIRKALIDEDLDRFNELIVGSTFIVELTALAKVTERLIEEYSDRPTKASSTSQGGQMPTPPISMDAGISTVSPTPGNFQPIDGSTLSTPQSSMTQAL